MPTDSTNPNWIEAPPPKKSGSGCAGKGCLFLAGFAILTVLVIGLGSYLLFSGGSKPTQLPIEDLPPAQLSEVQERAEKFQSAPAATNEATPERGAPTSEPDRQLVLSGSEINGLISANPKSRGHAYVSISGNTAHVQMSLSTDKIPGFPKGYLNGAFTITTDGPTPITELQISKIQANGFPIPSGILTMSVGGKSIMDYALEGAAPYDVSTAEIRDGRVILR